MNTTRIFLPSIVLAVVLAVGLAPLAVAAPISYEGATVTFMDVDEGDPPLYGVPTSTPNANTLFFTPSSFKAVSELGVPPGEIIDGYLGMNILADPGYCIPGIRIDEGGDYSLVSFLGGGTANTRVSVGVGIELTILEVDGVGIEWIETVRNSNDNIVPYSGDFNLIDDPGMPVDWNGSSFIDVAAILADLEEEHGEIGDCVTKVHLSVNNILLAASERLSIARIAKKDFSVTVIPEPSCLTLLGIGFGGVLLTMWRRRR